MKKLLLSTLAVAAMAAGGAVLAQSGAADCQTGIAWGPPNPGCLHPDERGQAWPGPHGPYFDPRIGYYDPRVYTPAPRRATPYPLGAVIQQPSRRDRDGDGVRNRNDRFPNDPNRY